MGTTESPETRSDPRTILLVEEEPVVRSMTAELLRGFGYEVLEVDSAAEATALSTTFPGPIDVLLTALSLRGTSGFELAESVRRDRPDAHVVFFSGLHADAIDRARAQSLRATVLPKPFRVEDLTRTIAEAAGTST